MKCILIVSLVIIAALAEPNYPKETSPEIEDFKRGLTGQGGWQDSKQEYGPSLDDPSYRLRREASEMDAPVEEDLKGAETHHYSYYPYRYYGHYYPSYGYAYPSYGYAPYGYGYRRYWG
ncbi:uncharacterized protein LOC136032127 isoform X2 [Artemia franciscana]|uniref:uncharacterized protein LOC136032127 isoform X1 n=1 Tax=Artemia franciscana TaxID=6661 RepID=UPI0032DBD37B